MAENQRFLATQSLVAACRIVDRRHKKTLCASFNHPHADTHALFTHFSKAFVGPSVFSSARLVVAPSTSTATTTTELLSCRTNAKKEKIKRNRENMRKFKTGGRKGLSRRKLLKKAQSSKARQIEAEFIAKCFLTLPPPVEEQSNSRYPNKY